MIAPDPLYAAGKRQFWEKRSLIFALIALMAVPLLYPHLPPLVDLPGHMGRFRVQLDLAYSPWLPIYYDFSWRAIGNLCVDLLIIPMNKLFGLELGVKLIILAIPPMMAAGFLWVAREVHGREPPTAFFALPFVYAHPFMFGFVNYALSIALAFVAFGLWLRLARVGRLGLRAVLFVPISIIVFFAHAFGWGVLGLMGFSAEAVRQHDRGIGWFKAGFKAALHASVMALPLLLIITWRSDMPEGMTRSFFQWGLKWEWVHMALRDRWREYDWISLGAVAAILLFAIFSKRLALSRNLLFSALVLIAVYLLLPWTVFGSAYADMRLAPYMVAVLVLAIRFRGVTHLPTARTLAILGLAFVLIRTAGTTASMVIAARDQDAKLAALNMVPMGSRVAILVGRDCGRAWALPRNSHIGGMVIVRREGFSNDQWAISGSNPLRVHYPPAGLFQADPSQVVRPEGCGRKRWSVERAMRALPRDAFDYLWLVDVPPFDPKLIVDMRRLWSGPGSSLYRISRDGAAPPPATPRTAAEPAR